MITNANLATVMWSQQNKMDQEQEQTQEQNQKDVQITVRVF